MLNINFDEIKNLDKDQLLAKFKDVVDSVQEESRKAEEKHREEIAQLASLHSALNVKVDNNPFDFKKYKKDSTFKGRMMYQLFLAKDTGSKISEKTVSDALNTILIVVKKANELNADQVEIKFLDQDVNIQDVKILNIFEGAFVINEVSDDFETLYSKRFFPRSVIDLGIPKDWTMPTVREFEEAMHIIKTMFKYMREEFISLNSLHNTMNVSGFMKECAHKSDDGRFWIARRGNSDRYFIPQYIPELNNCLVWKDEFYSDYAHHYIDEYFDKFVYPILKGRRD